MVMQTAQCQIYKTSKRDGAYLYLESSTSMEQLPESLQQLFVDRVKVLELALTPITRLATQDPQEVLDNLRRHGFHLQLKPAQTAGLFIDAID